MSGPKGIEYELAQARRRLEEARARWQGLRARCDHLARRAAAHGVAVPAVAVPEALGDTADDVEAVCARFEEQIVGAEELLNAALVERAGRAVAIDISAGLDQIAAHDDAARRAAGSQASPASQAELGDAAPAFDVGAHRREVVDRLRAAAFVDAAVERAARSAATASTAAEAAMSLSELSSTIARAARTREHRQAQLSQLGAVRAAVGALLRPAALSQRLDRVEASIDGGADESAALDQIVVLARTQAADEQRERDRRAVLDSLRASLGELGYATVDVGLDTPDSLVARRAGDGHAVQVSVGDEVDIRSVVADGQATTPAQDKAADDALCEALPELLEAMTADGITPGRVRKQPAGLVPAKRIPGLATVPSTGGTAEKADRPARKRRPRQQGAGR
ncbi:hypothetical protein GOARA_013_00120 [Gordonia araii NBRC 100433]|uniref:Uncharacterized protein n=1 Tax=Gordonia araii NBRC 100433 TaxID=1073574 RepID=G7GY93_9ACTN|nr:hypothetical protein [Gordonia araii]NNG97434.1 hypothetical protein [Gordonia araii NBRC 100433]GAB08568.1 hypothetical protein GOARA_013_00120 [Gordonia araii NBRC 100433]